MDINQMKRMAASLWIVSFCALSVVSCGGGGGGDSGVGGSVAVNNLTGFVATGAPVRDAVVTAGNGMVMVTARTDSAGRYTLNGISQFTFPLEVTATNPANPDQELSTVVLQGQRIANITPATTACIFWPNWTAILAETGHGFWLKLDSFFNRPRGCSH
jgi:hypothetical protein